MDSKEIVKRFDQVQSQRSTVEQTWETIESFVVPYRGRFFKELNNDHEVEWRRRDVFDSTAIMDAQNLSASIHGNLTSPSVKWFNLRFRDDQLNDDVEASKWLEECEERVYQALMDSAFNLEISECYLDLVSFGTSVLVEEVDEKNGMYDGLNFQAIPVREMFFEEDHKGDVLVLYRKLQWTAVQIVEKFGEDGCPDTICEKAKATAGDEKIDVIFCVYPRKGRENADVSKPLAPNARPFGFKYVLKNSAEVLGEEGGYYEMPAFVGRWRKTSGSIWGNSPATYALADILTLNQLVELDLRAREKAVDPATVTTERGLLGDLDLEPGGLTVVRSMDEMKPYESAARFDATNDKMGQLQQAIHRYFFVDQLELKESPAMTATEANIRYELIQRLLGPTLGRITSDILDPLVERSFNVLYRAGQLPPPPDIVKESQAELDINYLGPMARAQQADVVGSIERLAGFVAQLAQINPDAIGLVKWDEMTREAQKAYGTPSNVMKSEEELAEEAEQKAQMEAQMQQMQQAQMAGEAMQSMGQGQQAMQEAAPAGGAVEQLLGGGQGAA